VKDPEIYLREMGLDIPCAVRRDNEARIEPELRVQVNHDLFFVSHADYAEKIRKNPLKYCKLLTDPVTREVFRPKKKSPRIDYAGKSYFFSSDSTRAVFASNPPMYEFPPESMSRRSPADSTAVPDSAKSAASANPAPGAPTSAPDSSKGAASGG
jgi:YHS domain-containing protein